MNKTMRAAVLKGIDQLEITDVPMPVPGDDDVIIKVSACGICGSDIPRIKSTGTYHFPTIPGHEFGGTVSEAGQNVAPGWIGKRAAVIPLVPCYQCSPCQTGQYAQCRQYDFLGSRSDGGFAEYVKVPVKNLVEIPARVSDNAAAFLEPVSVALHVIQNNQVYYGDSVAVFGLGAIGIFVAQWAKAFGAAHVFAIDTDPEKVKIAREKLELPDALCIGVDPVNEIIMEQTKGNGVDAVFEASGSPAAFSQAISLLRTGGRLGPVGRPTGSLEITNETFEKILRSQLTIKGTWSFEFTDFPHHAWQLGLEALKDGRIKTDPIVSHRFPLSKTRDGVTIMEQKKEFFYKILVEPGL